MKHTRSWHFAFVATAMLIMTGQGMAQPADDSEKEIERYRAMINDPMANPGYLAVDRGEQLWALKRGEKNVSLEACDLGEGAGKLEGAFARLPRYFADTNKVMDLEQRLLHCMTGIQGLDTKDVIARRFGGPGRESDMEGLVAFIGNKSNGMKYDPQTKHPMERETIQLGEALFNRRGGQMDFACATCHAVEGKRIRLQGLPDLSKPGKRAQETMGGWPTYRVSQSQTRTMQHRLWDCYRQQRHPAPEYASEGLTALSAYMVTMAAGGEINVPSIKR